MTDDDELRRKAAEQARARGGDTTEDPAEMSPEDIRHLLHELRVHQIELEMQNEQLRAAQIELDASRARYFDLYDLAPIAYCTLSESGLMQEANLTAATLLQVTRSALIEQPVSRFILAEDQDVYYLHRKRLLESGETQICELRMLRVDGSPFWARLQTSSARDECGQLLFRVMFSDVTEHKQAEAERQRLQSLLHQTQKMEAVGRLAGGIAHNLNNSSA